MKNSCFNDILRTRPLFLTPGLFRRILFGLCSLAGSCIFSFSGCLFHSQYSGFYVEHRLNLPRSRIPLPAKTINPEISSKTKQTDTYSVRTRFFLMHSANSRHEASNNQAIQLALSGNWNEAHSRWETLRKSSEDDCAVFNNLGLARFLTGGRPGALKALSRAAHLCPGEKNITTNLRQLLGSGNAPTPVYKYNPES